MNEMRNYRQLESLCNSASSALFIMDERQHCVYLNPAAVALTGYTLDELKDRAFHDVVHHTRVDGSPYPSDECPIVRVFPENARQQGEEVFVHKEGHFYHIAYTVSPLTDGGKTTGTVIEVQDISARKRAENASLEIEQAYRRLADAMPQLVWTARPDGRVDYYNARADLYEGFSKKADNSWSWAPALHPDDVAVTVSAWEKSITQETIYRCEHRVRMRDGSYRWHLSRAEPARDTFGQIIKWYGSATDIQELRVTQHTLMQREAQFRQIANGLPQLVWVTRPDGWHEWYNDRWYEYTGATPENCLGDNWVCYFHPEDRPEANRRWRHAIATGETYRTEYRCLRYDGEWRWFLGVAMPLRGADDGIVRWFGTCTDIHDQKTAEKALQRSNQELEEFAYVSSHDLQEPLRKVSLYTDLLLSDLESDDRSQIGLYSSFIRSGVQRMQMLIHDLLSYSRVVHHAAELDTPKADLSAALSDALQALDLDIRQKGAQIDAGTLPIVRGDQTQLSLVFQNLIANGLKYQPHGQRPRIAIDAAKDGDSWVISIQDNGVGFAPKYSEKIFGLFKRLYKDEYPGTGLGLAICKRIVERYDGRIWASSSGEGTGATFSFCLYDKAGHSN